MFSNLNDSEYVQFLRKHRPFGWDFDDPPLFESYSFERIDPFYWTAWLRESWKYCYYAGAIYIVAIFSLQRYMENRPAFKLKGPLFIWNFCLGIFSIVGFSRTAPELISLLSRPNGFFNSVCTKTGMNISPAFWGLLFAFSKYVELGDTVFLVLRKRPLVFLQWYHHLATLVVVWTVAPLLEPIGIWYGTLNYGVHALMYPYFALKTIGVNVPSKVSNLITTLQLTQMIVGFSVNMTSLYLLKSGYECARYPISIKAFNIVYGSFIFLFGKLFYESVIQGQKVTKSKYI